jgi:hypothetical protein
MPIIQHGDEIAGITGSSLTLTNNAPTPGAINIGGDLRQNVQLRAAQSATIALHHNVVSLHNTGRLDITYTVTA